MSAIMMKKQNEEESCQSGSQLSATFVESLHQWRDLNISLLISACTHLSLFPSTTALPSPFISCSLSLSTAVWWEDQGLQRGWVPQGEYQQRCSALRQLSGSADVDVIRYLMAEEAELTEGTQERVIAILMQTFDICRFETWTIV